MNRLSGPWLVRRVLGILSLGAVSSCLAVAPIDGDTETTDANGPDEATPPGGKADSPHADTAAVVERYPGGAVDRVDQRIEDRPVGDRIAAIEHRFSFAVWRGD